MIALLEMLSSPAVETTAEGPEGEIGVAGKALVAEIDLAGWRRSRGEDRESALAAIVWAESIGDEALVRALEAPGLRVRDAGGRRGLEEDAEAIAASRETAGPIAVCVRAYEPPLLEMLDFLVDLRGGVGADRQIVVVLLGGEGSDLDAWRRKLGALGDPGLVCLPLSPDRAGVST